jgi:hypothetical protein
MFKDAENPDGAGKLLFRDRENPDGAGKIAVWSIRVLNFDFITGSMN